MKESCILIAGNYGAANLGDDAILAGILMDLEALGFKGQIAVMGGEKANTGLKQLPLAPSSWKSRLKFLANRNLNQFAQKAQLLILGGGGLFVDTEGGDAPKIWFKQTEWAQRNKLPYICYGQSVGPLESQSSQNYAYNSFDGAQAIHVRDEASRFFLNDLGLKKRISVGTDAAIVALMDERRSQSSSKKERLLFIPRLWPGFSKKDWNEWLKGAEAFSKEKGLDICLMGMGGEQEDLLELGKPVLEVNTWQEAFQAIAESDYVLSMRLHGAIFAWAAKTPCLAISYSKKIKDFFRNQEEAAIQIIEGGGASEIEAALSVLKGSVLGPQKIHLQVNQDFLKSVLTDLGLIPEL